MCCRFQLEVNAYLKETAQDCGTIEGFHPGNRKVAKTKVAFYV